MPGRSSASSANPIQYHGTTVLSREGDTDHGLRLTQINISSSPSLSLGLGLSHDLRNGHDGTDHGSTAAPHPAQDTARQSSSLDYATIEASSPYLARTLPSAQQQLQLQPSAQTIRHLRLQLQGPQNDDQLHDLTEHASSIQMEQLQHDDNEDLTSPARITTDFMPLAVVSSGIAANQESTIAAISITSVAGTPASTAVAAATRGPHEYEHHASILTPVAESQPPIIYLSSYDYRNDSNCHGDNSSSSAVNNQTLPTSKCITHSATIPRFTEHNPRRTFGMHGFPLCLSHTDHTSQPKLNNDRGSGDVFGIVNAVESAPLSFPLPRAITTSVAISPLSDYEDFYGSKLKKDTLRICPYDSSIENSSSKCGSDIDNHLSSSFHWKTTDTVDHTRNDNGFVSLIKRDQGLTNDYDIALRSNPCCALASKGNHQAIDYNLKDTTHAKGGASRRNTVLDCKIKNDLGTTTAESHGSSERGRLSLWPLHYSKSNNSCSTVDTDNAETSRSLPLDRGRNVDIGPLTGITADKTTTMTTITATTRTSASQAAALATRGSNPRIVLHDDIASPSLGLPRPDAKNTPYAAKRREKSPNLGRVQGGLGSDLTDFIPLSTLACTYRIRLPSKISLHWSKSSQPKTRLFQYSHNAQPDPPQGRNIAKHSCQDPIIYRSLPLSNKSVVIEGAIDQSLEEESLLWSPYGGQDHEYFMMYKEYKIDRGAVISNARDIWKTKGRRGRAPYSLKDYSMPSDPIIGLLGSAHTMNAVSVFAEASSFLGTDNYSWARSGSRKRRTSQSTSSHEGSSWTTNRKDTIMSLIDNLSAFKRQHSLQQQKQGRQTRTFVAIANINPPLATSLAQNVRPSGTPTTAAGIINELVSSITSTSMLVDRDGEAISTTAIPQGVASVGIAAPYIVSGLNRTRWIHHSPHGHLGAHVYSLPEGQDQPPEHDRERPGADNDNETEHDLASSSAGPQQPLSIQHTQAYEETQQQQPPYPQISPVAPQQGHSFAYPTPLYRHQHATPRILFGGTPMSRTPYSLPSTAQANEPIAHQIRRIQSSHIRNLQTHWEQQRRRQQQQQQQQQHQRQQSQLIPFLSSVPMERHHAGPILPLLYPPQHLHDIPDTTRPSLQGEHGIYRDPAAGMIWSSGVPLIRESLQSSMNAHSSAGSLSSFNSLHTSSTRTGLPGGHNIDDNDGTVGLGAGIVSPDPPPYSPPTIPSSPVSLSSSYIGSTTVSNLTPSPSEPPVSGASEGQGLQRDQPWRTRPMGINSLYSNYEGGTLKPSERWRRGDEEMIGR
ncbi:hypothetical protein BC939DRAFT_456527 [Gamsiella multidivaricata]|uniref:uncharacterized protein n=1 Tax=Gamsiella multidivaricata TaxID=101098 RepID=UPI0022208514|nr:uncharacterized protein BC939DRAFT_456527 [Gamsiella multidivaricata]KAI7821101.1 hypothetical protein BC939DRAFT_456527 [Gamsiella multidivaricata]